MNLLPPVFSKNLANYSGKGKRMTDKYHEGYKRIEPLLSTDLLTACNVTGYGT
jgi:hypothetical protein